MSTKKPEAGKVTAIKAITAKVNKQEATKQVQMFPLSVKERTKAMKTIVTLELRYERQLNEKRTTLEELNGKIRATRARIVKLSTQVNASS